MAKYKIENKIIFIPSSRNKKKLETFIQQVEKKKIFNLTIINLYKLNIEKIVDVKREKIYKSYLSFEIQIKLGRLDSRTHPA